MATAAELTTDLLVGIAGLGVPWWGWTALIVMFLFAIVFPSVLENAPDEPVPGLKVPR
jgi:hypothetical protein